MSFDIGSDAWNLHVSNMGLIRLKGLASAYGWEWIYVDPAAEGLDPEEIELVKTGCLIMPENARSIADALERALPNIPEEVTVEEMLVRLRSRRTMQPEYPVEKLAELLASWSGEWGRDAIRRGIEIFRGGMVEIC